MNEYNVKKQATHTVTVLAENKEEAKEKAKETAWAWTEATLDLELVE